MTLIIPRKWTLRVGDNRVTFSKGLSGESGEHVLMKALLWGLYLPTYPAVMVEVAIGDRYKPDLVARDETGKPVFWGEAGQVSVDKIRALGKRYRDTHFAMAKWDRRLVPVVDLVREALDSVERQAPFDLISFPRDSLTRFIDQDNHIHIRFEDVEWVRLAP